MPVAWGMLAFGCYPVLVFLAWRYVRAGRAQRARLRPGRRAVVSTTRFGFVAVLLVTVATLAIGTWGLRFSRTTSDFFVASRSVRPGLNASAISGEYLSAASFLGIAGLVLSFGAEMLWYPVGWTAGYLVLLVLVAAPLRRSGAYTLPDFAEARLDSRAVRTLASVMVVAIGWLYLMPQLQGAGVALRTATGLPPWAGGLVVAVVVLLNVLSGGMRSITFVQAFQYWLKLTALLVPLAFLLIVWLGDGGSSPADPSLLVGGESGTAWANPVDFAGGHPLYSTYSLMVATFLGTMGLPHVVVRFYTNPDGRAARQTTRRRARAARALLRAAAGVRRPRPPLRPRPRRQREPPTASCSSCPRGWSADLGGDLLTALLTAGAFAAFLATSSGLTIAVAGVISQDVMSKRLEGVTAFRVSAVVAVVVPFLLALVARDVGGRHRRRPGLRDGRGDLLPAARARDLVARADRRRRARRAARRRRAHRWRGR